MRVMGILDMDTDRSDDVPDVGDLEHGNGKALCVDEPFFRSLQPLQSREQIHFRDTGRRFVKGTTRAGLHICRRKRKRQASMLCLTPHKDFEGRPPQTERKETQCCL